MSIRYLRRLLVACCTLLSWHGRRIRAFSPSGSRLFGRRPGSCGSMLEASSSRKGGQGNRQRKSSSNRSPKNKAYTRRRPAEVRPIVTDYTANRNDVINNQRLNSAIDCEHFAECPGCSVNDRVGNVEVIQSAKLYFSSTAVRSRRMDNHDGDFYGDEHHDFFRVVVPSSLVHWRTQAKLAAAPKSSSWARDGCAFGLYQRGTHSVLPIPNCMVHHPSINRACQALMDATLRVGTAAYEKDSLQGGLRYVQCQVDRISEKVSLTLVWHAESLKETQPALSRLVKELQRVEPDLWHSIWCHCNDGTGNNIFSRNANRWHRMVGPEFMREPLPVGNKGWLYFSPLAFRQGNIDGFDVLAMDVAKHVPSGSRVCELYAGVGVLGLTALAYHHELGNPLVWVRCSDENPANPRCFRRSVDSLPTDMTGKDSGSPSKKESSMTLGELIAQMESGAQSASSGPEPEKMSYMVASAAKALKDGQALGANVLIVDPPRRGLEELVLQELCKPFNPSQPYVENKNTLTIPDHKVNWTNDIETLVYVSCGFDALARDCDMLLSSRAGWVLTSATGYVLFPGSDHVETVSVFKRRRT